MSDPTQAFPVQASDVPLWRNIMAVYDGTSDLERLRGLQWYERAWDFSRALAETHWHHGTQRRTIQAAGIVAALAQNTGWDRNVELALATFKAKGELNGGTFQTVRDKCGRIFKGEDPYAVLSGPKITAFFACIAAQGNCDDVCVDRHATHIAYGRILENRERNQALRQTQSRNGYEAVASAYRIACQHINRRDHAKLTPARLQAITWVAWRNVLLGEDRGFKANGENP